MKKVYSSAFKAQVVLELLKEEKTLAQLSSEHGVPVTVLREWKAFALKGLASLFERRDKGVEQTAAHEKQLEELYAEIGRLTTQVNWLKKVALLNAAQRRALVERDDRESTSRISAYVRVGSIWLPCWIGTHATW
jgi:putative transposase